MSALGRYRDWWPWLRGFDAEELAVGARWSCAVRPPAPYLLRFTLVLDEVEQARRITAHVEGDVSGQARLTLEPVPSGRGEDGTGASAGGECGPGRCDVVLTSSLAPVHSVLRLVAATAPAVARFGHAWVLDTGARQFRTAALGAAAPGPSR